MLNLTRKIGQSIVINNEIYVTVLGVKGNQIRLGIDAPKAIPVHREEIQIRIENESHPSLLSLAVPEELTRPMTH
jgi:carbon storage regulator